MKLCIHCEHYRPAPENLPSERYSECHHPRFTSPVTGKIDPQTCSVQREYESQCGREAKFFEPAKCEKCERPAVQGDPLCESCAQNYAEAMYEREQSEGFRGSEASAYLALTQSEAQRLK